MNESQVDEAIEAARKAIEIGPPNEVSEHVIVLDYYEALAPERSAGASLRPRVREQLISPFYKMLRGLTQALRESARSDLDSREAFRLARKRFRIACAERQVWKHEASLKTLRNQAARKIAARRGGLMAWLWQLFVISGA